MTAALACELLGTAAAAAFVAALWTRQLTGAWVAWLLLFAAAEGLALVLGTGTLSAHVWHLRASRRAVYAILGAGAVAVAVWLVYHFGVEPDWLAGLRRTYRDDGVIAAAAFVLALGSALLTRRR